MSRPPAVFALEDSKRLALPYLSGCIVAAVQAVPALAEARQHFARQVVS